MKRKSRKANLNELSIDENSSELSIDDLSDSLLEIVALLISLKARSEIERSRASKIWMILSTLDSSTSMSKLKRN